MKKVFTKGFLFAAMSLLFGACGENYIDEPVSSDEYYLPEKRIEMDTTSSHHLYKYKYAEGVVEFTSEQTACLDDSKKVLPGDLKIYLNHEVPEGLIPKQGTIIVIPQSGEKVPLPYMGRIEYIDGVEMRMSEVRLEDVFSDLEMDIRLNAEQLSELPAVVYTVDDASAEEITDNEFFENAPSSALKNAVDGADATMTTGRSRASSPFTDDTVDDREQGSIELRKIEGGFQISASQAFKHPKLSEKYPVEIEAEGMITFRPLYKEIKKTIKDSYEEKQYEEEGWEIDFGTKLGFEISNNSLGRPLAIKTPTLGAVVPIPYTTLLLWFRDRLEIGLKGAVNFGFGWNNKTQFKVRKEIRNGEVVKSSIESDFNWQDGLKWEVERLTMTGSFYIQNNLASHLGGCSLALMGKQKATLSGTADVLDAALYAKNPMLSFDLSTSAHIYMMDPRDWTNLGWNISCSAPPISYDRFAIFPQCDNAVGLRGKGSPDGEVKYQNDIFYLLWPLVRKLDMDIVDEEWFNNRSESHVFGHFEPSFVDRKNFVSNYKLQFTGLNPEREYYAVPKCNVLGKEYYGTPIPLAATKLRIGIIGPGRYMGYDMDVYVSFAYGNDGRISMIDNRMADTKSYFTYNPAQIKSVEYVVDEHNNYVPRYVSNIKNMKFDEKSGVLTSCRWYEDGDYGNVKLYYDDQYHLTGVSDHGTDGSSTTSIEWDKDGRLLRINSHEDGGGTVMDFKYPAVFDESNKNTHLQWTLIAGMGFGELGMGRLVGRPTSYLPTGVVITEKYSDGTDVTAYSIKYEFNEDGSVAKESYNVEGIWVHMPYGYRMVGVSDEEIARDKFLGTSRNSGQNTKRQPFVNFKLFGKKRKTNQ